MHKDIPNSRPAGARVKKLLTPPKVAIDRRLLDPAPPPLVALTQPLMSLASAHTSEIQHPNAERVSFYPWGQV